MPQAAVVDTNILVSAMLRLDSPPGQVVRALAQGQLMPAVCREVMDEYTNVLRRPSFGFDRDDVEELLTLIGQQATWVQITPYPQALSLPDPSDWPFIAVALAVRCPVITGNAKHFPERAGVQVMTARLWLGGQHGTLA